MTVGVYFSGNEAGQQYITQQLGPFYQSDVVRFDDAASLDSVITPELVAWGNTQYNASNTENPFTCTEANECYINRFFGCAHYYHYTEYKGPLHMMQFALCFFNTANVLTNPEPAAQTCALQVWQSSTGFTRMQNCATGNTTSVYNIFLRMQAETQNVYPTLTTCKCDSFFGYIV